MKRLQYINAKVFLISTAILVGVKSYAQVYSVQWTNVVGSTVSGSTITKTAATGWGNSGASSLNILPANTDGWMEIRMQGTTIPNVMIGLSSADVDQTYTSINFGFYPYGGSVRENGAAKNTMSVAVPWEIFRVERIAGVIYYKRNGNIVFTSTQASTSSLIVDLSINTTGNIISNVTCSFGAPSQQPLALAYNTVWQNPIGVTVNSNNLTKTASNGWGSGGASTVNALYPNTNGWIQFTLDNTAQQKAFGLTRVDTDANYTSIDYAFLINGASVSVMTTGTSQFSFTAAVGDILRVERSGTNILYKQNGSTVYTVANAYTTSLFGDASIYNTGATLNNVQTSFWIPYTQGNTPDVTEFASLKTLYDSLAGSGWITKTNWPTAGNWPASATAAQMGTWYGITVTYGDVSQIALSSNHLIGRIPSSISNLTQLSSLGLHVNSGLTGPIPPSISALANLQSLYLYQCGLNGSIPPGLFNLASLGVVSLAGNNLTGAIPDNIGNCTSLNYFSVSVNKLNGQIPYGLGTLPLLVTFAADHNQLSGSIPSSLGSTPKLLYMYLGVNQLSGPLPSTLFANNQLRTLDVSNNQLTGSIPASVGNSALLTTLNLSANNLSGNIPPEMGNLTGLNYLYLCVNQLSGGIPSTFSNLSKLVYVDLHANQLNGSLPDGFGNFPLTQLILNDNQFTGGIPSSYANLKTLTTLKLYNNKLGGPIDDGMFANWSSIQAIQLWSNSFTGTFPSSIGNATTVNSVYASDNKFTSLPSSLLTLPAIAMISFPNNQLVTIPNFSSQVNKANLTLTLTNNLLDFSLLESQSGIKSFTYNPQANLTPQQTVNWIYNTSDTLKVVVAGTHNLYQWQKYVSSAWQNVSGATSNKYIVPTTHASDSGRYRLAITDPLVPGTTLYSGTFKVVTINCPPPSVSPIQPICAGNSATLSATGQNVKWYKDAAATKLRSSNSSFMTTVLQSDSTYYVTQSIGGASSTPLAVTVTVMSLPTVTPISNTSICFGKSTTLSVTGSASSYSWNNGLGQGTSISVSPTVTTTYQVTGTSSNGCASTGNVTVIVNSLPPAAISPASITICSGTVPQLTASGGATYLWSDGGAASSFTSILNSSATVSVTATDSRGCSASASATVTVNAGPSVVPSADQTVCNGTSASLSVAGDALSYSWNNNLGQGTSFTVSPTTTTTYTVTGTGSNGCTKTAAVTVTVQTADAISVKPAAAQICNGSSIDITVNSASGVLWSDGSTSSTRTLSPTETTTYTISTTNNSGCATSVDLIVQVDYCSNLLAYPNNQALDSLEIQVLKNIYDSLGGANWTNKSNWPNTNWNFDNVTNISSWFGVSVMNRHIVGIDLERNNLSGTIPKSISALSELQELNLSQNHISGSIPQTLSKLAKLATLNLQSNQLSGSIPDPILLIPALNYLNVTSNSFTGNLPAPDISSLIPYFNSNLHFFYCADNQLSGSIPVYQNFPLANLDFSHNQLSGSIPNNFLGRFSNVYFNNNKLSGNLPTSYVPSYNGLTVLNLAYNQLTGQIGQDFINNYSVSDLNLSHNHLSGNLPNLQAGSRLSTLNLSYNDLDGDLQRLTGSPYYDWYYSISLNELYLQNNKLTGVAWPILSAEQNFGGPRFRKKHTVDISNNQIQDFVDYRVYSASANSIQADSIDLRLSNNLIPPGSLEPYVQNKVFKSVYTTQQSISMPTQINKAVGDQLIIALPNPGQFSAITWQKQINGVWTTINSTNEDPTQKAFMKSQLSTSDYGVYHVSMTNSEVTGAFTSNLINVVPPETKTYDMVPDSIEFSALKDFYTNLQNNGLGSWTNNSGWPAFFNSSGWQWPQTATAAQMGTWFGITVANGDIIKINLPHNNLAGEIPPSIGDLTQLTELDLSNNEVGFGLPSSIKNLRNLVKLNLLFNTWNGWWAMVPNELGFLSQLQELRITGGGYYGNPLPASLGNLTNLTRFQIFGGGVYWELPWYLGYCKKIQSVSIFGGSVSSLPGSWANMTSLKYLTLEGLGLTGGLPSWIPQLPNLIYLGLGENNLSGGIPPEIGNMSTLQILDLNNNRFSGSIPTNFSKLSSLKSLILNSNQLSGKMPNELGSLTNLQQLSLANNSLSDTIPRALGRLANLTLLNLSYNQLSGSIPSSLSGLANLGWFFANNNQLSGQIPAFGNPPTLGLTYYDLFTDQMLFNSGAGWTRTFDFSNNQFSSIADYSPMASKNLVSINVANNHLTLGDVENYFDSNKNTLFNSFDCTGQNYITPILPLAITVKDGDNGLLIPVTATNPGQYTSYLWTKQGLDVNDVNEDTTGKTFTIADPSNSDSGMYGVTLSNTHAPCSVVSSLVQVTVNVTPPILTHGKPFYNGNIAAMTWRTEAAYTTGLSDYKGLYLFDYDDKYQLIEAQFGTPNFTTVGFTLAHNKFRETGYSYDPNGNILSLKRYSSTGGKLHDLAYTYSYNLDATKNDNKLQSVTNGGSSFRSYHYNEVGQMSEQDNATGADQIVDYDVTGKVTYVYADEVKSKKVTHYTYDDRGFRLSKETYDASGTLQFTTWYIRDASGNVLSTYEQMPNAQNITLIETPIYGSGKLGLYRPKSDGGGEYVYELTDHLGNVRATIKNDQTVYLATMEDNGNATDYSNPRNIEKNYFKNLAETEQRDTRMNHTPPSAAVSSPGNTSYLSWNTGDALEKAIGAAITLKVEKNDQVSLEAWAKYKNAGSYSRDAGAATIASLLASTFVGANGLENIASATQDFMNGVPLVMANTNNDNTNTKPYAYLNYLVFDKNFVRQDGGARRVPLAAGFDALMETAVQPQRVWFEQPITINQPGYIYIWVSNESAGTQVWWDDLKVTLTGNRVTQATDYYAHGMVSRSQSVSSEPEYRFGYQGEFAEKDDETGWNHFKLRDFDPVISRWLVTDPKREFASPYVGMGNNPNSVDPDGACISCLLTRNPLTGNYNFNSVASHLLSLVSGVSEAQIKNAVVQERRTGQYRPFYNANDGGGAITLGTLDYKTITYTENWFALNSNDYNGNGFGGPIGFYEWLELSSHEVGHLRQIDWEGGLINYVGEFIKQYSTSGTHDGAPYEKLADNGSNSFRSFNDFVNKRYGNGALFRLFKLDQTDQWKMDRLDHWHGEFLESIRPEAPEPIKDR